MSIPHNHVCRVKAYGGAGSLLFFVRVVGVPANAARCGSKHIHPHQLYTHRPSYYQLDGARSLRDNLAGLHVVEFPRIAVVLPDSAAANAFPTVPRPVVKDAGDTHAGSDDEAAGDAVDASYAVEIETAEPTDLQDVECTA